jgi:hypothetical protein
MKKFFLTESERNQIKSLYRTKGLLNEEDDELEYGVVEYDNGKYDGNYKIVAPWRRKIREGYGTFVWKNGNKYVGDWKDDSENGYGTFTWASGIEYVGEWKDSKMNGYGTLTYTDGTVKQGNWVNSEFQGGGENSTQNDSTTTPPGNASTGTGSTEQPENCDELMELAKAESVYNVCNLQNGKVFIGLKNKGPLVKYIQCVLNQQETELAQLTLDGIFGPKTKEKVEKFQKNNEGLKVDGIVGQKTFEKFNLTTGC